MIQFKGSAVAEHSATRDTLKVSLGDGGASFPGPTGSQACKACIRRQEGPKGVIRYVTRAQAARLEQVPRMGTCSA